MEDLDKERLKADLEGRLRKAKEALRQANMNVALWTAAVELWSQLDESQELRDATAAQFVAQNEQGELEALISRLERGIEFLQR